MASLGDALRDVLILGARVLTLDPSRPTADAVALRGDRVLGVGSPDELRDLLAPGTRTISLDGGCLLPAFHDSHVHLAQHGFELAQVDLHTAPTLEVALQRIAERAASLPEGSWVVGAGFALQRWGVDRLDRAPLDRVAPRHPVLLRSQDHHSAWVNGLALELAGITAESPDPADGTIVRGEDGEATGLLLERALHLVWDRVPPPTREDIAGAVARAGRDLASRGIATVHHMSYEPAEYWREIGVAASRDGFPLRVWACIDQEDIEHAAEIGLAGGQGGAGFVVGGAKFFADGALGSRTAWMLEPYRGLDSNGVAVHGPDILAERFPLAIAAGLAPVTHAIGDAACRAVLDALEATEPQWRERSLRPRLEHAQHMTAEDVGRLGRLGVVASMQPIHLTFDVPSINNLLPDRRERAYATRSLLKAGATLAFGSDTPVAAPDVIEGLRAACRRRGIDGEVLCPEERLTVGEALAAYTSGAAKAIGREDRSGMLRPGFDADLVLLSHDPSDSLDDLSVLATLKGGRATFDPAGRLREVEGVVA